MNTTPPATPPSRRTILWVLSTYFAEGFPFTVVRFLSSVFFTDLGAKESVIGYLNALNIPWNLKFLWAPLLDVYGTKRGWLVCMQAIHAALLFLAALLCICAYLSPQQTIAQTLIALLFVVMAIFAATNDVAIDAYYLAGLTERPQQALYSGYRVMAYRIAVIFVKSGLVGLIAYCAWLPLCTATETNRWYCLPQMVTLLHLKSGDPYLPWAYTFTCGGLLFALLALGHWRYLPRFEAARLSAPLLGQTFAFFAQAFRTYLEQHKIGVVLGFIIFYRIGDEVLFSMVTPFMMRELLVTKAQYSWIGGWIGATGSIVGAMLGGWWIQRTGLTRAIWPITLLMNLAIWFYIGLAWYKPSATTLEGVSLIASIHFVEQVAAGLGAAALLVFLLGTCHREFKAAHYAIGSAIMSIPATVLGVFSGNFVEAFGYTTLFISAFVLTLPAMAFIPFVPLHSGTKVGETAH